MSYQLAEKISARLEAVQKRINEAAIRAGRDPKEVTLVAVTKTWPSEVVRIAYQLGVGHIGENRAEELAAKRIELQEQQSDSDSLVWHQIGTLQSRKTRLVAQYADMFEALDRLKVANRLSSQLSDFDRQLPVLLEVNLSGESTKSGYMASSWEESATQRESLRSVIWTVSQLPNLQLQGLMTMAPWGEEESVVRRVFRQTRLLRDWLQSELPQVSLSQLSMGMTDDFEIAIEEGATIVRIGRAIFGSRH